MQGIHQIQSQFHNTENEFMLRLDLDNFGQIANWLIFIYRNEYVAYLLVSQMWVACIYYVLNCIVGVAKRKVSEWVSVRAKGMKP